MTHQSLPLGVTLEFFPCVLIVIGSLAFGMLSRNLVLFVFGNILDKEDRGSNLFPVTRGKDQRWKEENKPRGQEGLPANPTALAAGKEMGPQVTKR